MRSRFVSNCVKDFNERYEPGQKVLYYPLQKQMGCNCAVRTYTTTPAGFCKKTGLAKVFIKGEKECIPFHHIKVVDDPESDFVDNHIWCRASQHHW